MKYKFTADIVGKEIKVHQRKLFSAFLEEFKGKKIKFIASEAKERDLRNLEQNALYWVLVTEIAKNTGENKEVLHDIFKYQFFGKDVTTTLENGKTWLHRQPCLTTTELDTKEFAKGVDKIIKWASEFLGFEFKSTNEAPRIK